jgi:hypothetical protein
MGLQTRKLNVILNSSHKCNFSDELMILIGQAVELTH